MVIDCHGHFTTVPAAHGQWRQAQLEAFEQGQTAPPYPQLGDDEIVTCVASQQLATMNQRGIDLTIFSPQASAMGHHRGDQETSAQWSRHCNDLIYRVTQLFPGRFAGVCQLPQSPRAGMDESVAELRRAVLELGFVGCNLNPDPSGGRWEGPPLTDSSWYPLYEAMVELEVPAMIHVTGSACAACHTTGAYYLAADTTAFMQLVQGNLFDEFPSLRFVIPHGGGAVPYHWGRYRGLADMLGTGEVERLLRNVYFDTCVYHQPGVNLLLEVIPHRNVLFGSEMIGAVRGIDPNTGHYFDDTKRYVDAAAVDADARKRIYEDNVIAVYPRLGHVMASTPG